MQEQVYHSNFKQENEYFWFIARNKIVLDVFEKVCTLEKGSNVIDIGCGTGGFASKLLDKGYAVTGTDTEPIALDYSRKRGLTDLHLGTLDNFQATKDYKAAFMLDVIEHIEDDRGVVKQVYDLLPSGAWFTTTVPAYQWMWSHHDEIHKHYRRYSMSGFRNLIEGAGFKTKYSSHFNTLLFPMALGKRLIDRIASSKENPHDEVPGFLNKAFTKIFSSESGILQKTSIPFGLSILVISQKP
ncbi:MAG: class I SAM-dependent methyltransferase [Candidatus Kapaibacteriales bacterium]